MVVLGKGAVSYERGTPVATSSHAAGVEGVFQPFWAESPLPRSKEPPNGPTLVPTVGHAAYRRDHSLADCSGNPFEVRCTEETLRS